jgi:hypothetical protein
MDNVYVIPINPKLPWFKPNNIPHRYIQDIFDGKDPSMRYYVGKIL